MRETEPTVEVEQAGPVRWLYLNRPRRRNAINEQLLSTLEEQLALATDDGGTEVIALGGRGPSFCSGADLRHLLSIRDKDGEPLAFLGRVSQACSSIQQCPKPVIAAVHGHVVAGGLELALACDFVVAAEGTLVGDGHLRNGLLPAAGSSVRLPRKVGSAMARRLMLTGELIAARSFLASGWIESIVPAAALVPQVETLGRRLTAVAGPAQQNMKALLNEQERPNSDLALAVEAHAVEAHWAKTDVAAALEAFLSSRSGRPAEVERG